MSAAVDDIFKAIELLSDDDRDIIAARIAELDEARWNDEAAEARRIAAEQGIGQAEIDKTIDKLRYK